jgi:FtsH-binding integral membrane protein
MDNSPSVSSGPITRTVSGSLFTSFISQVYLLLSGGLVITTVIALLISNRMMESFKFADTIGDLIPILFLVEFVIVIAISAGYKKFNAAVTGTLFALYSVSNGIFFGALLTLYEMDSAILAFFATMLTFLVMSIYGSVAKQDLTKFGNIALMSLIGLIIVSVVNIFANSDALSWVITYAGLIIFIILVAYDTQKLKAIAAQAEAKGESSIKHAVYGALMLYLDFINLFIYILRILGSRRD